MAPSNRDQASTGDWVGYRDFHFEPGRLLIDRKSDADTCGWRGLFQTVRYSDGVIMRGKLLGQGGSAANRTAINNRQTQEFNVPGGCNVLDMKAAGRETQLEWVSVHRKILGSTVSPRMNAK